MKVVSWNVNSLKMRLPHIERFVKEHDPDFVLLQELKGEAVPVDKIEEFGYKTYFKSQKARNGVAILAKEDAELVLDVLPGNDDDEQARYIEVKHGDVHIIGIYAPNGNPVDTEKYDYKLEWLERLHKRLSDLRSSRTPFLIGGDFNIIPENKDTHDPVLWADDALFRRESRQRYRAICNLGLTDAFRVFNQAEEQFTFWDYQAGAWPKNHGIRIDHFLLSPDIADRLQSCAIVSETRGWEKPSDHVPIMVGIA
jgi:exodeoxyribonuclease-3